MIFKIFFIVLTFNFSFAQTKPRSLTLPELSPKASVQQMVGISTVTITYHRPSVRGRKVWGKLVPYGLNDGKPWRAGANENTTIKFEHGVFINQKFLKPGTYGIHIIPTKRNKWILILSNSSTSWGSFTYNPNEDALRVTMDIKKTAFTEQLKYEFTDISFNEAKVWLSWGKIKAGFKLRFDTHEVVLKSIRQELRGINAFSWYAWKDAAWYCLQNNVHIPQALKWINESIRRNQNHENVWIKAQLHLLEGEKKKAIIWYNKAIELAPQNRHLEYKTSWKAMMFQNN